VSFYSPIDRLAQNLPRPKGTGSEFMTELSKMPGYKTQEAEDRGLQALTNLPKMERAQFMEALKAKPPVMPTEDEPWENYHENYTLPGGSNYREILLLHPDGRFKGVPRHFGGEANILASIRAKDREGPNGEKILHIEEVQSDWHQQGREKGYTPPDVQKQITDAERAHWGLQKQLREAKQNAAYAEAGLDDPITKRMRDLNPEMNQRLEAAKIKHNNTIMELLPQVMKAEAKYQDLLHQSKNTVPDAPFKKSWHEMALKKMIHHAAENGYDSIAITPGAEQADRYGLAKHVGLIRHMTHGDNPNSGILFAYDPQGNQIVREDDVPHAKLPEYIGREGAKKLMDQKPDGVGYRELAGADLQIGGEGMKGFYDKIVPNFLNQFGKKYGAKVSTVPIESGEEMVPDNAGLGQIRSGKPNIVNLHHFPITPEMREDVTKNGVPLYAKGGEVEVKPTVKDETIQRKIPEMEEAAKALQAGTITRAQYDKVVKQHKPVKPYEFVPQPATDEDAERALMANKKAQWRGHEQWPAGRKVGLRLDIPAYENHGVWVNSIHDEEGNGEDKYPTAYNSVSSVKNATFDAKPEKAVRVATGEQNKSPFARIRGELHHMTEDEAVEHMKAHLNHPDYVQVGMDPRRHGYFYDRKTMKPITHSAHVVQIGPLVLAHKPTYGKRETYATGGPVPPLRPLNPQLAALREQMAAQSALHKAYDEAMKNVYTNQMPTFAQWVKSQGKAKGGTVEEMRKAIAGAAKSSGMKAPVVANRDLTTMQDSYESLNDRVRKGAMDMQDMIESMPFKYEPGQHVFTAHSARKNLPPFQIVRKALHGNDPVREDHPKLGAGMGKPVKDPVTGKTMRTPYEPGYHVRREVDGETQEYRIPESAILGHLKAGGAVKPVGYTKEQVTVSPNLDAMRYELMSVKRYTKKVK
jgi:hypothetical protein